MHEESSFCVSVMRNLGSLDFSLTAMQNFDTTLLQITNLHIGLSLRVNCFHNYHLPLKTRSETMKLSLSACSKFLRCSHFLIV